MSKIPFPAAEEEIDMLLRNARLRDELEPYVDEALEIVQSQSMSLAEENEFLESMLAWERAPALPISRWFDPPLSLPRPETLDDDVLSDLLYDTIDRLFSKRIALQQTEHLSNRQLYTLIFRDILPSWEKKVDLPGNRLSWRCVDESETEIWLTYYATETERLQWLETNEGPLPEAKSLPFPRNLPSWNDE
ncbi:MAG: hypothetical protein U0892_12725 [Pirellulales bacterium]